MILGEGNTKGAQGTIPSHTGLELFQHFPSAHCYDWQSFADHQDGRLGRAMAASKCALSQ